jgi:hypothetical protein
VTRRFVTQKQNASPIIYPWHGLTRRVTD